MSDIIFGTCSGCKGAFKDSVMIDELCPDCDYQNQANLDNLTSSDDE